MAKEKRVKIADKTNNPVLKFLGENMGILAALIVISAIVAIMSPVFLSVDNALSVGRQISTNAVLTLGMALVIITGGIDLSVGAVVALSGTLCVGFINKGMPVALAVVVCIGIGVFVGFINGIVIAKTGMAPFIVTMSTMNIGRGIAYLYSGGLPLRCTSDAFAVLGTGYLGPIPLPIVYLAILVFIVWLLLSRSKFGTYVYALGGNREAARFSGIPTVKIEVIVYTISGFLSGFAGVVLAARMFSGQPSVQQGAEMDAIAACVLGGVSMTGGMGKVGGTMIGALIIGVISNGLNLLNVNPFIANIVKGIIVLIAVYIDIIKKKKLMKG
ncbi:ribose ABC transporter permease [Lachnospiraceae bacterium OttesenSCG-928-E19]|nr:ribose ABC transporter permease [Lachnospiraceae bacterium OttesenSCG-928-E19]